MKFQLAPSVLSCDFADMGSFVESVSEAGAEWIHFDVMDGQFVPPITFGDAMVSALRGRVETAFEAHLMTLTPDRHFDAFIRAGCKRITFHAEVTPHAHRFIQSLQNQGIQAGIAINPATPVEMIKPLLQDVDLALVMTVNPGWGGQSLIERCLSKVAEIRKLAPNLDIQVDGGIDASTIRHAWDAGANVFVTGSYLSRATSVGEAIKVLRETCA